MLRHIVVLTAPLIFALTTNIAFADWTDDWFDNAVVDSPSSYDSQRRNFYSAGGIRARVDTSNDYLATVSLPRLKAGCGGIDLFMGGFAFLDEDYLVEKFQNMIQAAPAIAFNMALSTMSDKLANHVGKLESTTNWLNQLQLDDCAMSKTVIAEFNKDDPDVMGAMWNEMTQGKSLNDALTRGYQEQQERTVANEGRPTVDLTDSIEDCPAEFRALVSDGSMIENATRLAGMEEYADVIRGLLGDIEIATPDDALIPQVREVSACNNDQMTVDDMLFGQTMARRSVADGGECYADANQSVLSITQNNLRGIANSMVGNVALTPDQIGFIENNSFIPIFPILSQAIVPGNVDVEISSMSNIIGSAISYRIFNDLYRNTTIFMNKAMIAGSPIGTHDAANTRCDTKLFAHALDKFKRINDRLREYRTMAHTTYSSMRIEQNSNSTYTRYKREERDANRRQSSGDLVN
jgi:conjugative transfer pilus assembly protein TraH